MISLDDAKSLAIEAEQNNGLCTHCHQVIKIYRYGISDSMMRVLRAMADRTNEQLRIANISKNREVDADTLDLKHSERTQLTKMRFHGLVAKVKVDGVQKPRHWVITTKGWDFLGFKPIPAKVLVFNNQVLGHDGGVVTIDRIYGGAGEFEAQAVTEPEARAYSDVRTEKRQIEYQAEYRGYRQGILEPGRIYKLLVGRLQIGNPITAEVWDSLNNRYQFEYRDIASFQKTWKIIT